MSLEIRNATPADYDVVIPSLDVWWGGRRMATMLPRLFFQHFEPWTFVATRDGEVVGFLAALRSQTNTQQVYCHFIGVDPSERSSGIGSALYRRLFADALASGCLEILAVTSPSNRASMAFHQRLGFSPLPGAMALDGVPYSPDYDGPGEDRARLFKQLRTSVAGGSLSRSD